MTDDRATFDPRFDARFQRGYVADPAEPAAPDQPAAPGLDVAAGVAARSEAPAAPQPANVPAARQHSDGEPPTAPASIDLTPSDLTSTDPAPTDHTSGTRLPSPTLGQVVVTRWLWLVVAASVAFIVIGSGVYWSVLMRRNPFNGGLSADDALVDNIIMSLAPNVVFAGVLGIVAAVLAWALIGNPAAGRGRDGR